MPELTRDLTLEERALLGKLLEGEWPGATQARAQLLTSRRILATRLDLDFDIQVDTTLEPIAAPDGILKSTDQFVYRDGACIGGVMIWIKHGRLASFEYYSLSDLEYDRLPLPAEIRHEWGTPMSGTEELQ
ncbi:hypothetical protein GCM10028798_33960 [Humibacter antri]